MTARLGSWQWLALAAVLAGAAFLVFRGYAWQGPAGAERVLDIPTGAGTAAIGRQLQAAGVVRSAALFRYWALLSGQARRLQAGEYAFPPHAGLSEVVRQLAEGRTLKHAFTIPEGFTARQIADKLEAEGLARAGEFLAVVNDPALAADWHVPAPGLEGFLFPDTYEIPKGWTARQIARRMVDRFHEQTGESLWAAGRAQGLSPLQIVTLASIIEREVRVPAERPRVASVFYNRLRARQRLESCATVLYSLGRTGGDLSLEDLQTRSPYNTYRHRGLPPGPIGNPGLSSLQAAAHPAQTKYLYFVVGEDGHHIFSEDFETHKRAKWAHKRLRQRTAPRAASTPVP